MQLFYWIWKKNMRAPPATSKILQIRSYKTVLAFLACNCCIKCPCLFKRWCGHHRRLDASVNQPSNRQNESRHFNNVSHHHSGQSYLTDVARPNPHITGRFKLAIRFQGLNVNIQCWKVYLRVCPVPPGARFTGPHAVPFGRRAATHEKQLSLLSTHRRPIETELRPRAAAGLPYESDPTWLSLLCHRALYTTICLWLLGNTRQLHWQEARHFSL